MSQTFDELRKKYPALLGHYEVVRETSMPDLAMRQNELALLKEQVDKMDAILTELQALKTVWQQNGEKEREFLDKLLKMI